MKTISFETTPTAVATAPTEHGGFRGIIQIFRNKRRRKLLGSWARPFAPHFAGIATLRILDSLINTIIPLLTGNLLDLLISSHFSAIEARVLELAGLSTLSMIGNACENVAFAYVRESLAIRIKTACLSSLLSAKFSALAKSSVGAMTNRLSADADDISTGLCAFFIRTAASTGSFVIVLAAMLRLQPVLACLTLLTPIATMIINNIAAKRMATFQAEQRSVRDLYSENLRQMLSPTGLRLAKVLGLRTSYLLRVLAQLTAIRQLVIKSMVVSRGYQVASALASIVGPNIVLFVGILLIVGKSLTVGELVAFLAFQGRAAAPFSALTALSSNTTIRLVAFRRTLQLLDMPQELSGDKMFTASDLVASNVSLSFGNRSVLDSASLVIKSGEHVAICGDSGVGKSSFVQLLVRLLDADKGSISFGNLDLSQFDLNQLRSRVILVDHDGFMFNGTLRENISLGLSNVSDAKLMEVLEGTGADIALRRLAIDLDSVVSNFENHLSTGERQRFAMARALLRPADILILDEATSAIDERSEELILSKLRAKMRNRILIVISHRRTVQRSFDRLIELQNGQFVEILPSSIA